MRSLPTATAADARRACERGAICWQIADLDAALAEYEDEPWTALDVLDPEALPRRIAGNTIDACDRVHVVEVLRLLPGAVRDAYRSWRTTDGEWAPWYMDVRFLRRTLRKWQRGAL